MKQAIAKIARRSENPLKKWVKNRFFKKKGALITAHGAQRTLAAATTRAPPTPPGRGFRVLVWPSFIKELRRLAARAQQAAARLGPAAGAGGGEEDSLRPVLRPAVEQRA